MADALARASRNLSQPTQPVSPEAIAAIASTVLPESVAEALTSARARAHSPSRRSDHRGDRRSAARRVRRSTAVMRRSGAPACPCRQVPTRLSPRRTDHASGHGAQPRSGEPTAASTIRRACRSFPALPFLTLIQLARLGFVDPAAAALAAARVPAPAHVFAAAVAGKTLDPPARGWERSEAERAAVRLASGLERGRGRCRARRARGRRRHHRAGHWRAALVDLYVEGRSSDADVCVTRTGEERICGEEAGLLPIAWVEGDAELQEVLAQLGNPAVRTNDVLRPLFELLRTPPRDRRNQRPRRRARARSNRGNRDRQPRSGAVGRRRRRALTIERLRDLEASVVVADRVTIGVPRGQRWLDLRRAGLLDAWPVPWAPGGIWELVTW